VAALPHFLAAWSTPGPNSTRTFPIAFHLLRTQRSYAWNGKIRRRRSGSFPLKSLSSPSSPSLLFQSFLHLLSCHGSLQCPIHSCHREDDPSVERGTSCHGHVICVSRINRLGEDLRQGKGGHWRSQHAISDDRRPGGHVPWLVSHCWWLIDPLEVGHPSPARQSSPAAQGRGSRLVQALSPHQTIRKEHHWVMPTCPSTGVLTPKKITIRHKLVVPSSSNDDDLPLVRHNTRVDLNSDGMRICYTQEPALVLDTPLQGLPPYIVSGQ
jgi:hypothetical protein